MKLFEDSKFVDIPKRQHNSINLKSLSMVDNTYNNLNNFETKKQT